MVLLYGECGRKARSAARLYRERFPAGPHPSYQTILSVVKRLRETGCVTSRARSGRPAKVGRQVQPDEVLAYALTYPKCSTRQISEHCGLSKSQVWKILQESGAYPYRPMPQQVLLDGDVERRYSWCNFVMNRIQVQPTFLADVVWTDEACFSRNGMCNRQHTHYWALENPRCFTDVRHQVRFGINVWCAIYSNKFIGPIFYDGTLTGARYLQLLQNVMPDFVENLPVFNLRNVWFQHDGAPAHKTSPVKQYLVTEFGNQIIGYGGFEEWPPRSPDLTPLDFFLWGYLKQQVYATPQETLQDFKRRITDACANVSPSMLQRVQCEILTRIQMCIAADGAKFEHLK
jgi:transposase